jgi:alpha,alpha-trehalase
VVNAWTLVYEGFEPEQEGLREALCTLGNGYFATRGAAAENDADDIHYPGTYLAGGYNRLSTDIAGRVIENEDLVNLPNWLPLTFRIAGGSFFNPLAVELLSYRQELDLKNGVLARTLRFRDKQGQVTRMSSRRLVHMGNRHLAALETRLVAENWSGRVEILSALDGRVVNAGVERYRSLNNKHLEVLESDTVGNNGLYLKVQTRQSEIRIAQAARTQIFRNGSLDTVERQRIAEHGYVAHRFECELNQGNEIAVEKVITLFTSRDTAIPECGLKARAALAGVGRFSDLLESHTLAWNQLWRRFDIKIERRARYDEPDERMSMILHLHVFHLLQTISMHTMDMDVGVPSRGWHGEAYRGHIFWDELFIFPFLNLRLPKITRALLKYRHRRLAEARKAAREAGCRGAMFPWQSGSDGREESQQVHLNPKSGRWIRDDSRLQRHVSSAIAYNAWWYYEVTQDTEFLLFFGAEMILEIARFWSSMVSHNPDLDRYEILGVMGPDEYHDSYPDSSTPGLNNNAYTNVMAVWILCRALDVLSTLPEDRRKELCELLQIDDGEIRRWEEVSRKMRIVFHDDGIISQFEGYERLPEFDWEGYRKKYGNIQRLDRILEAEGDSPNRYKVSKQADVLMLFYLFSSEELKELFDRLGYPFAYQTIPQNIDYYIKRTSHGSTLSRVVHSWVLARSDRVRSWQLFREALESDIKDTQGGTTPEGIHLGAMAGTVDLIQRCSTGMVTRGDVLWFNPCLPEEISKLHIQIRYRRHSLDVEITHNTLRIRALKSPEPPIRIGLKDRVYDLEAGSVKELTFSAAGCDA